ncbi:hypothetical protein D3C86_714460 [compost metagenome]
MVTLDVPGAKVSGVAGAIDASGVSMVSASIRAGRETSAERRLAMMLRAVVVWETVTWLAETLFQLSSFH